MKYSYKGANKSETIKKYDIKNNNIVVSYLSNRKEYFDYSKEKELLLQEKMILQAIERNNNLDNNYFVKKILEYAFYMILETTISFIISNNYTKAESLNNNTLMLLNGTLQLLNDILFIYTGINVIRFDKRNDEFTKYRIYLSILNELKDYVNNEELLKNINNKKDILNINNLDSYSLKEIKKIEDNLNNIKKKALF